MSTVLLSDHAPAELYDAALRWHVPSRSDPHVTHLVELGDAPGYSVCDCQDFEIHFLPLLRRGVSPEAALRAGLVKRRKYHDSDADVFFCWHITQAYKALAKATVRSLVKARSLSCTAVRNGNHLGRARVAPEKPERLTACATNPETNQWRH